MNWLEDLNAAMAYIEDNLHGGLAISDIAQRAACSEFHLQRMFPYLTGMTLAEYIRRRKMSVAAMDLVSSDMRIVDLAHRYGYDSPTAFNRAFQKVHGVPPSKVRDEGVLLTSYPRLTFVLSVKGEEAMDYKIIEMPAFRVVGLRADNGEWTLENSSEKASAFWGEIGPRVHEVLDCMDGSEPKGLLGVSFCGENGQNKGYMVAVATSAECPEGLAERMVPAATYAVFECTGPMPDAMQKLQHRIISEWLPASGYEWAPLSDIERYFGPDMTAPDYKSEVWLPIRKA